MVPLLCSYDTAIKWISQGENGGDAGWWKVGKWSGFWRGKFCFTSLVRIAARIIGRQWMPSGSYSKILPIALPMTFNPHFK